MYILYVRNNIILCALFSRVGQLQVNIFLENCKIQCYTCVKNMRRKLACVARVYFMCYRRSNISYEAGKGGRIKSETDSTLYRLKKIHLFFSVENIFRSQRPV